MVNIFVFSLGLLAILGIINSGHLILERIKRKPLVCPIGGDCNDVLTSKYSKIFFVKNDVLGFLYYVFILVLAFIISSLSTNLIKYELIISGIALLFSAYLVFVQAKVLRKYCFYCLISALINLLIFLNLLIL